MVAAPNPRKASTYEDLIGSEYRDPFKLEVIYFQAERNLRKEDDEIHGMHRLA
jgi:hypothetical protein